MLLEKRTIIPLHSRLRIFRRNFKRFIKSFDFLLIIIAILFSMFDFLNFDAYYYNLFCNSLNYYSMNLTCTNFYDVKYWEGLVAIGTIFTAFFAYKSINQSNKDSMLAQKPFVVFQDRIYLNSSNEVSGISLKNIGIGLAYNITLSVRALDTSNDFIDKSNPKVIHLSPNETHSMWALDNNKLLASLRSVGMKGNNIINMTNSATLRLFVHYYDSFSNEYVTEATFKRSGNFIKVVDLDYWGMKEI